MMSLCNKFRNGQAGLNLFYLGEKRSHDNLNAANLVIMRYEKNNMYEHETGSKYEKFNLFLEQKRLKYSELVLKIQVIQS